MTATDPTSLALLQAISTDPADDTARLVYADWLEENGQPARAEFIRKWVAVGRYTPPPEEPWVDGSYRRPNVVAWTTHGKERRLHWGVGTSSKFWPKGTIRAVLGGLPVFDGGELTLDRGFVSAVTCSAADWLTHADALCWHPAQTMECAKCEGGVVGKPKPGSVGGQWRGRMCDCCDGTGRVPRPFPATAQPIERVTLTTTPLVSSWGSGLLTHNADGSYTDERWPGIVFVLPRTYATRNTATGEPGPRVPRGGFEMRFAD